MAGRLAGKRALITAAAQGIGRASAEAFVREGARVVATDINPDALATLHGCETRQLDVTDGAAIEALAGAVGPIDILFNCAGLVPAGTTLMDSKRRWSASVRADGSIACDGHSGSIHQVGAKLQGAPSCNGWSFWHVEEGRSLQPLDALRQRHLAGLG